MAKSWIWLLAGAAVLVAGWLLSRIPPDPSYAWQIRAATPVLVGNADDPFAYDGSAIRDVSGSVSIRLTEPEADGTVVASLEAPEAGAPLGLLDGSASGRSWKLEASIDGSSPVWVDTPIHGDTPLGEAQLAQTQARLAGRSQFELIVDGKRSRSDLTGFWSVADALRRPDGSIRQQGLLFSPLLRDKTGFSDRSRDELTLLLYETRAMEVLLAQVVFGDITIVEAPPEAAG